MDTVVLDVKGLNCPLPILRARKAIRQVPEGGFLKVLATDPNVPKDFQVFCRSTGYTLLENAAKDGVFVILIQKTTRE